MVVVGSCFGQKMFGMEKKIERVSNLSLWQGWSEWNGPSLAHSISVARHALDQILCMLTTLFEIPEIRVGSESVTRDVPR